jgi:CBS domain containing-hemolysin-like protein
MIASAGHARASIFEGETLDAIANAISWVALILAPIIGLSVFWLVHILPEKIAEKKRHPQAAAIQCLCLLSLCFGGLLWPIAWLWAYTKPVLHKMAYGTDVDDSHGHQDDSTAKSKKGRPAAAEVEKRREGAQEPASKLNPKGGTA